MKAVDLDEAINRLHHAVNERRGAYVKVSVEDLKAVLYDYAKQYQRNAQ